MVEALQAGQNPFTLWKEVKLPQYSNLVRYDEWFELNVLAVGLSLILGMVLNESDWLLLNLIMTMLLINCW